MHEGFVLTLCEMVKQYPGTRALDQASFNLRYGEVHALVGENGAGKSTLAKIISGAQQRTEGTILLAGQPVEWHSPVEATRAGIAIVHQELDLIPTLTGAENIFLGQRRFFRAGLLDWGAQRRAAQEIVDRLGIRVPLNCPVRTLSLAEQQLITIAKALSGSDQRVIIMDEPTSALAHHEIDQLFTIIRRLKAQNIAFIYISHHLTELFQIADRVTVMRDGRDVLTEDIAALSKESIARAMVGREVQAAAPSTGKTLGEVVLEVSDLSRSPSLSHIDLTVRRREIVGITGLMGCGNIALANILFGMAAPDHGTIRIAGRAVTLTSPIVAVQQGIALVPEDRKTEGIIPRSSVAFNISLPIVKTLTRLGIVHRARERAVVDGQVAALRVRTSSISKHVRLLSGGNQQKVVLAKSLVSDPKLLLLIEPTRGVDVGAKAEIHERLTQFAADGLSLILFSSDLAELLILCDRIIIMERGGIRGEFARGTTNQTELTAYVIGSAETAHAVSG